MKHQNQIKESVRRVRGEWEESERRVGGEWEESWRRVRGGLEEGWRAERAAGREEPGRSLGGAKEGSESCDRARSERENAGAGCGIAGE
jgi:hypothetical protein